MGQSRTPEQHVEAVKALLGRRPQVSLSPAEALGRALSRDVVSPGDSPAFDNSQMDGYALGEAHLAGGTFTVGPSVAAGADPDAAVPEGIGQQIIAIMTGAKLPRGTRAVVPVERCRPPEFIEEGPVMVPATQRGQFVRRRGSDIREGAVLFEAGHVVNPRTVAACALLGVDVLPVERPASIVVCTGGDEVGGAGVASIPDANGPLIESMAAEARIEVTARISTPDDPSTLRARLAEAVAKHSPDAVVTSGGISHGKREVVRQVLEPTGGWFGHVSQQPGGPQGLSSFKGTPVISLPGNPVSTAVSFRLFVAPVLGHAPSTIRAELAAPVRGIEGRDCFYRGVLEFDKPRAVARVLEGAGSHLIAQSAAATCLIRIPASADYQAGESVAVYPW